MKKIKYNIFILNHLINIFLKNNMDIINIKQRIKQKNYIKTPT